MKDTEKKSQVGETASEPNESIERLKHLIDSSPSIIYACKPTGDFPATFMSAKVTNLLGYDPSEFLENPSLWSDCIHPDDKERIFDNLSSLFDRGHHVHEYRFRHKNGSYRWMRDELSLMSDTEGTPLEIIGSWTDVTLRMQAEIALAESEKKYRTFVSNFQGIAFRGTTEFTPVFFHGEVEEITGYSEEDFVSGTPTWDKVIFPDDLPMALEDGNKMRIIPNYKYQREYRIVRKDGQVVWIHETASNVCDDSGSPIFVEGTIYDITRRKTAEEELRESKEQYRAIVEDLTAMVCRFLPNGTLTFVNGEYCRSFGKTCDELIKSNFFQFIPEEHREKVKRKFLSLDKQMPTITYEHQVVTPGGDIRWQQWTDRALFNERGEVAEYQSLGRDITESKQAKDALREAKEHLEKQNAQLRKLDKIKDGLIRDVSHELKTPVAKHAMQLEILKPIITEHGLSNEEIRAFSVMEESIRRQEHVVRNLLDLSLLESGGRVYRKEPIRLDEIIREVIGDYQYAIESYGIDIVLDVHPVTIQSDGEMFWHLFSNLFNNAIKYRSTSILARITVSVEPRLNEVLVRIADNGIGIEEDDKQVLFERFYQASTASEGCGVGLAICKKIAEGLGGRVELESEGRGKGTVALVAIPLS